MILFILQLAMKVHQNKFKQQRRPHLFTDDEFNHSDLDKRSFRSENKPKDTQYNFQERLQDYLEEEPPIHRTRVKSDYLTSLKLPQQPTNLPLQSNNSYLEQVSKTQPIKMRKNSKGSALQQFDYDKLYKKIKLKPLMEQAHQSDTLQNPNKSENPEISTMKVQVYYGHTAGNRKGLFVKNKRMLADSISLFEIPFRKTLRQSSEIVSSTNLLKEQQKLNNQNNVPDLRLPLTLNLNEQIQTEQYRQMRDSALQTSQIEPVIMYVEKPQKQLVDEAQQTSYIQHKQRINIQCKQPITMNKNKQSHEIQSTNEKTKANDRDSKILDLENFSENNTRSNELINQIKQLNLQTYQPNRMDRPVQDKQQSLEPCYQQPQKPKMVETNYDNTSNGFKPESTFTIDEHFNHIKLTHVEEEKKQSRMESFEIHQNQFEKQTFDIRLYMKIYYCLKGIQANLKTSNLLKCIKEYVQLIASGRIDNYEFIRIPLHKKKILKLSLLYERIGIIIIAFAYSSGTIGDNSKNLSVLIRYILSSYLIALKVMTSQYSQSFEGEEQFKQIWKLSNKQFQNKGFQNLKENNQSVIQTIYRLSKTDNLFYENLKQFIKNYHKFTIQQTFYYVLEYFAFFLNVCQLEHTIPFLAVAPNPYLPNTDTSKYTLIIDFIEIFCLFKKQQPHFRPYSQYFLDELSEYYEIVSFSNGFPNHINKIIDTLDKKKRISHRLYKHHAIKINGFYHKDLTRIGRDLSKIVLIDSERNKSNSQNCINIKSWTGNNKDTTLAELCPILAMIVIKKMEVQTALDKFKQQMSKNIKSGVKYINYGMNFD